MTKTLLIINVNDSFGRAGSITGDSRSTNVTESVSGSESNTGGSEVITDNASAGDCIKTSSSAVFVTYRNHHIFLILLPSGFLNCLVIDFNSSVLIVYFGNY